MLVEPRTALARGRRRCGGDSPKSSGAEQPVQHATDLEVGEAGDVHEVARRARPVEQRQQSALGLDQRLVGVHAAAPLALERKDGVERGDLLGDYAPLVHAARALEQQAVGVEAAARRRLLGPHTRLEREGAAGPGEERVDRLLDLPTHLTLDILGREEAELTQHRAETLPRDRLLHGDGLRQLFGAESSGGDEALAQTIGARDHAGKGDPSVVEPDRAEVALVRRPRGSRCAAPRKSSCTTSGSDASRSEPLIAISSTPRAAARRCRAMSRPSSRASEWHRHPAPAAAAATRPGARRGDLPCHRGSRAVVERERRLPLLGGREQSLHQLLHCRAARWQGARRDSRPGRHRTAAAPQQPLHLLHARFTIGRAKLEHEPAGQARGEPRLEAFELRRGATVVVNAIWRPDSSSRL